MIVCMSWARLDVGRWCLGSESGKGKEETRKLKMLYYPRPEECVCGEDERGGVRNVRGWLRTLARNELDIWILRRGHSIPKHEAFRR
jgi:hypothetical protein